MIAFVNAKINIGLQIVGKRPDGYHDLQTLFYPVGIHAGSPANPVPFCDILEIIPRNEPGIALHRSGNPIDCEVEKDLVYKAASLMLAKSNNAEATTDINNQFTCVGFDIYLEKHLPEQAGMGGGSADAAFTMKMISEMTGCGLTLRDAAPIGADCPFFLINRPAYARGIGDELTPVPVDLHGYWLTVAKPYITVSTREAFSGICPAKSKFNLRKLPCIPVTEWSKYVHNDFEDSLFPFHPELEHIKHALYALGAEYASLTGSGSCLYGIFNNRLAAELAKEELKNHPTIKQCYLLKL